MTLSRRLLFAALALVAFNVSGVFAVEITPEGAKLKNLTAKDWK